MSSAEEHCGECSARDMAYLQVHQTSKERETWQDTGSSEKVSTSHSQV